ncbi:MAG TPA: type II CAAX endopeptidase family protein [Sphingomicrobium sp.]|nr:type II CAAX endopeptidase family protein [Sphingomicrobium sp.]
MEESAIVGEVRSRRIIDFPLVCLVIALAAVIVAIGLALPISQLVPALPGFSAEMTVDLVAAILLVAAYKLVVRHLGEAPRDELRLKGSLRPLALGLFGGAAIFSLIVIVAAIAGVYRIVGLGSANTLLAALVSTAIFPAISEEIVFRGILFRWIEEFGGSWAALVLTSALFGAAHLANPHSSAIAAFGIALEAGMLLGAAYMLTRSLWMPIGLHAAWNFTQGQVYDIPVSGIEAEGLVEAQLSGPPLLTGDAFGLEASPIAMVVAALFGLWLLRLAIRRGQLVAPWWVRRRRIGSDAP